MRRLLYPLRLAVSRLRSRAGRAVLVAFGVAAGAAVLAAVSAGSLVARDRSLDRALARVAPADRVVRAVWGGVPGQAAADWRSRDRLARAQLRPRHPFGSMLLRQTRIGGTLVDLGAVDGLARWVSLRSGRLPRRCTPARCEVLQLGGTGPLPRDPHLHLVRVGRGRLASEVPFGSFVDPSAYEPRIAAALAYHQPPQPPLLVAEGVAGLAADEDLADIYRSYAWTVPLGHVHPWQVGAFTRHVEAAGTALATADGAFEVDAPLDDLAAAQQASRVAARRLFLVGGEAAALVLAFALLAAATLRRDSEAAARRLTWLGARRWQLAALAGAEAAVIAAGGTLAGWLVGAGAGALVADAAGSPAGGVLAHSLATGGGVALALAAAAAATLVLFAALRAPAVRVGSFALGPLDVAALGALAAIGLALARGKADPEALAREGGTGVLLLLLPGLVALVAAVVCVRALPPALRLLERSTRSSRRVPVRLAALSLARHPGQSAVAAAFLVVSLGLALFAAVYRSTLTRNQADEAAFAVPADYVVQENLSRLLVPFAAAPPARFRRLGDPLPVVRLSAETGAQPLTLLGVPARGLPGLDGWRSDFASVPRHELARRLAPGFATALSGVRLPAGARELALRLETRGDPLQVSANVETRSGEFVPVPLGVSGGRAVLRGRIPAAARGGRLVGVQLGITRFQRGNGIELPARGRISLRGLPAGWIGVNGVDLVRGRYLVTPELTSRVRPRQPTDGRVVPAAVSPQLARLAGRDGLLPLQIVDQRLVVRVVATLRRFPTVDGPLVLADEGWLSTALNADAPGAAVPGEVWLRAGPGAAAALARPPFDLLDVSSRRALLADLRGDPLARGVLLALGAAALLALVLALASLLLALVAELRDERGELADLEAQGAAPRTLRHHLRLRALIVLAFGLLGGAAAGAALAALATAVVALAAGATTPVPPLALTVQWPVVAGGAAIYAAASALVVLVATRAGFREVRP
jgi:hypothetical protein